MPDVAELKACPRCGNTNISIHIDPHAVCNIGWAECKDCGLAAPNKFQRACRHNVDPPDDIFRSMICEAWNEVAEGYESKLEPCPFCGGTAKLVHATPYNTVQCQECGSCGRTVLDTYKFRDGIIAAIEAWNRRATIDG